MKCSAEVSLIQLVLYYRSHLSLNNFVLSYWVEIPDVEKLSQEKPILE